MKIGAGGLQSQIIEDAIKIRQVDPARNKPGQDDCNFFDLLDGRNKARHELFPPLGEPTGSAVVDNFNGQQWLALENKAMSDKSNTLINQPVGAYVDIYV